MDFLEDKVKDFQGREEIKKKIELTERRREWASADEQRQIVEVIINMNSLINNSV